MNMKENVGPSDSMSAGLAANVKIADGFPAPFIRYRVDAIGPLENQRPQYIAARDRYIAAMTAGNEALVAAYYDDLMAFILEPKWSEDVTNLVMTAGKTDIIDKYLKGSSYTAAWFLGLKGAGTIAAGDTLASHAGWTEVTPYSGNRPGITWGTTTTGSNTATAVSISITSTSTVAGAFVCTVATGTSGVLYSCSDFSASRSVSNGDTLNVTATESCT